MKFGQDFQTALTEESYPKDWVDSAISYKKLKKCIKKVRRELLSLGLDAKTLEALWQHVSTSSKITELNGGHDDRFLHYAVDDDKAAKFVPRLTVLIDPEDGSPMDAWLSPETRRYLRRLARGSSASTVTSPEEVDTPEEELQRQLSTNGETANGVNGHDVLETVEIPLTSDSEFFQILRQELISLDALQSKEQKNIEGEIAELAHAIQTLKVSKSKKSKSQVEEWRRIFEVYTAYQVFLSSNEADAGSRDSVHAQRQLQNFNKEVSQALQNQPISKDANVALDQFLQINYDLLRLLKFQEINRTALSKIMKKFDKQTALHARSHIPDSITQGSAVSKDLARATCFTIANELLELLPQINDYSCPVCFGIAYKPVRLKCGHLFCIRCLIVMQTEKKNACPLCRAEVVQEADEENIDLPLKRFLELNFKEDIKKKQKENEYLLAIDKYGDTYGKKCIVM